MISIPQPDGGLLVALTPLLIGGGMGLITVAFLLPLSIVKTRKTGLGICAGIGVVLIALGVVGGVQFTEAQAFTRQTIEKAYGIQLSDESAQNLLGHGSVKLSSPQDIYYSYNGALYTNTVVADEGDKPGTFTLIAFDDIQKGEPFEDRLAAGVSATPLNEMNRD